MRPRGRTPRMRYRSHKVVEAARVASMRPRGRTPRMPPQEPAGRPDPQSRFNEAAGAYPADAGRTEFLLRAPRPASMRPRGRTPRMHDRRARRARPVPRASMRPRGRTPRMPASRRASPTTQLPRFNEAAGAYPADAGGRRSRDHRFARDASMRPRGRTPRMLNHLGPLEVRQVASMRPRGRTPRMPGS